jgi:hypothetical protein
MYAPVSGDDGMLMQRASLPALGVLPALTRELIEGLLDVAWMPAPELAVLVALRNVAAAIPLAFAQLDAFALSDVADIALVLAARIGDTVQCAHDEEAPRVGARRLVFLTRLAASPAFLDTAIQACRPHSPNCDQSSDESQASIRERHRSPETRTNLEREICDGINRGDAKLTLKEPRAMTKVIDKNHECKAHQGRKAIAPTPQGPTACAGGPRYHI